VRQVQLLDCIALMVMWRMLKFVFAKYDVEGSFRIAYFLEAVFFLFFIFRSYDKIDANDRKHVVLMNMAFCFCAILLFFIRSENGGRLSWFYMIGVIATITYLYFLERKGLTNDMSITLGNC
jgi:hypothetical protein